MGRQTEKRIIRFLRENGPSFLGEVVKGLKLSYTKGLEHITNMSSKGIIRRSESPLRYELKSDAE